MGIGVPGDVDQQMLDLLGHIETLLQDLETEDGLTPTEQVAVSREALLAVLPYVRPALKADVSGAQLRYQVGLGLLKKLDEATGRPSETIDESEAMQAPPAAVVRCGQVSDYHGICHRVVNHAGTHRAANGKEWLR